jgi:hypothetical protein
VQARAEAINEAKVVEQCQAVACCGRVREEVVGYLFSRKNTLLSKEMQEIVITRSEMRRKVTEEIIGNARTSV